MMSNISLRMRDVVEQTGIGEATLRAWEQRYGFPAPHRLPSGHRRYAAADVERLRDAARLRDSGVPTATAIARAPTVVQFISRPLFHRVLREYPGGAARLRAAIETNLRNFAEATKA